MQQQLWEREVQPLKIDWAPLIEELQTISVENYQLHELELHPSQTGVVHHLGYHQFDRVTNVKIDGGRAEGLIFAIVRDPQITNEGDADVCSPFQKSNGKLIAFFMSIWKLASRETHINRSPERISFVRETAGWKIDSIPFR